MRDGRKGGQGRIHRAIPATKAITAWLKDALIASAAAFFVVLAYHVLVAAPKVEKLLSDSDKAVQSVDQSARHLDEAVKYARDTLRTVKESSQKQSRYWDEISTRASQNLASLKRATDNLADLERDTNSQLNGSLLPGIAKSVSEQNSNLTATLANANKSLDALQESESLAILSLENIASVTGDKDIPEAIHHVNHTLDRVDIWTTRATKKPNVIVHGIVMVLKVLATVAQIHSGL